MRLCQKYQVNGQTAWSLLKKAERFQIKAMSALDDNVLEKMRAKGIAADEVSTIVENAKSGYIITSGAKLRVVD